jgi:hypothetical protein
MSFNPYATQALKTFQAFVFCQDNRLSQVAIRLVEPKTNRHEDDVDSSFRISPQCSPLFLPPLVMSGASGVNALNRTVARIEERHPCSSLGLRRCCASGLHMPASPSNQDGTLARLSTQPRLQTSCTFLRLVITIRFLQTSSYHAEKLQGVICALRAS